MATIRLMLDTRAKKDGSQMVLLVMRLGGHRYVFSTGIAAPSAAKFDEVRLLDRSVAQYKVKNVRLSDLKNRAEKLMIDEEAKLVLLPVEKVKAIIGERVFDEREVKKVKRFVDYLDEFVAMKANKGTKTVYTTTRNKLEEYDPECTFETMDKKWLERFEVWMADCGMRVNAYAIHLRNIRAVFNYAIDEEYTTLYPFRRFSIKKEETRKRSLTVEQLRTLRDYPCEEYQVRYRDIFMLMFYLIGVNASDLFLAKKSDVVNGRLEYKRHKTGRLYSVKIEPEAQEIIDRYAGKGDYLLNVMDDYGNYKDFLHRMGLGLKQIGELERKGLGGKKMRQPLFPDLSSYWSRHTWATIAAGLDVPKEVIAHALGHSWADNTTTDIYINFNEKKVDEANRRVIDYVFGEKED